MRHPRRLSVLFFIGVLAAGSSALGYLYYFVYEPPLAAAEAFMRAMEAKDAEALQELVLVTPDREATALRAPMPSEITTLLTGEFHRGRVLDQDRQTGASQNYNYLIYREPDGSIYKLIAAQMGLKYKIVIPERPVYPETPYLWDYNWTN
ncbi:MAG TPA: hypothetical protein VFE29_04565 [Terriglobia bacterium]|nr:hypothetical protein [Terriglobia bacterium]